MPQEILEDCCHTATFSNHNVIRPEINNRSDNKKGKNTYLYIYILKSQILLNN